MSFLSLSTFFSFYISIFIVANFFFTLCLLVSTSFLSSLYAQAYVRASFGPGIGVSRDAFGLPALTRDSNEVVIEQRTVFGSFGNGLRASIAGGYWFTPYFGADLSVYYFAGFKQTYGGSVSASGSYYERTDITFQVRIAPSLEVRVPEGKEWACAARGTRREKDTEIYGKFSLGFESSAGIEYAISDRISIFAQVTYSGLRILSKNAQAIRDIDVDANGDVTDRLENGAVAFSKVEFQDVLTNESNVLALLGGFFPDLPSDVVLQIDDTLDLDRPLNLPAQSINSNSLLLEVGLQYIFKKK